MFLGIGQLLGLNKTVFYEVVALHTWKRDGRDVESGIKIIISSCQKVVSFVLGLVSTLTHLLPGAAQSSV